MKGLKKDAENLKGVDNLKELRIADIATITNGYAFKSEQFNSDGIGLPIIRIRDVQGGTSKTYYLGEYSDEYLVKNGDILIGMDGEFNINTWKSGKALLNQRVCKIAAKAEIADNTFLRYRLSLLLKQIEADTPFVTVKHLSSNVLQEQRINVPPIAEQKRIAAICAKADRLRRTRRYALELSDTYLRSVFLEMFGDPLTNPKGWKTGKIEELCMQIVDCPHSTPTYSDGKTPYACVRSADIQNGIFDWTETKYVDLKEYQVRIERLIPQPHDVVYCREGARFGNAARIPPNHSVCLGQRMMLFRVNAKLATSEFIWFILNSDSVYQQAVNLVGGTASPHVNVQDIKAFKTIIPPLLLQEKFAAIVQKSDRIRAQQREALRQAEHLFQTILHRAFRGEL
ncbi:restriction endonuclease subunit S [Pseudanabaena yagii]|uniref:Type I restriction modification DNA specificity domain-containing protein n=1 Tax=Pseudanabaena yagii GIHE-NHR1 TaxID=2722753 RepID=A0ABX1LUS1_9CYAN|nr:restriction endonuclease subunit S [Pseudanabaena yagii]NMF59913.1 hypothetical protein [Pseudanabaena yagii GIHE-NHR1]